MSLGLGKVVLCRRYLGGPSHEVFLVTCARCSRNVPCVGSVCAPLIVEPQLLLAYQWQEGYSKAD